jgi:hypothetical protein
VTVPPLVSVAGKLERPSSPRIPVAGSPVASSISVTVAPSISAPVAPSNTRLSGSIRAVSESVSAAFAASV